MDSAHQQAWVDLEDHALALILQYEDLVPLYSHLPCVVFTDPINRSVLHALHHSPRGSVDNVDVSGKVTALMMRALPPADYEVRSTELRQCLLRLIRRWYALQTATERAVFQAEWNLMTPEEQLQATSETDIQGRWN